MQNENPEGLKSGDSELDKLIQLKPELSSKWGGSITFLQRYVSQALKRIQKGPSQLTNPEEEFIQQDIEDYLHYKCKEHVPGETYSCEICKKKFKGEDFVIKHIRNKHEDVVNETYERESTKEWLKKTI